MTEPLHLFLLFSFPTLVLFLSPSGATPGQPDPPSGQLGQGSSRTDTEVSSLQHAVMPANKRALSCQKAWVTGGACLGGCRGLAGGTCHSRGHSLSQDFSQSSRAAREEVRAPPSTLPTAGYIQLGWQDQNTAKEIKSEGNALQTQNISSQAFQSLP